MGSSKSYATNIIKDDQFLSVVATIGSFSGILRFVWSVSLEKLNFKTTYVICLVLQITLSIVIPLMMESSVSFGVKKSLYTMTSVIVNLCMGCHYVIYPLILAKIYGSAGGVQAYMVGLFFHAIGSLSNTVGVKILFNKIGFKGMSFMWGAFNVFSLILLLTVYKGSKTK